MLRVANKVTIHAIEELFQMQALGLVLKRHIWLLVILAMQVMAVNKLMVMTIKLHFQMQVTGVVLNKMADMRRMRVANKATVHAIKQLFQMQAAGLVLKRHIWLLVIIAMPMIVVKN